MDTVAPITTAAVSSGTTVGNGWYSSAVGVTLNAYDPGVVQLVSWGDGSGVPTSGQNLLVAGLDSNKLLHIRTFDSSGVMTNIYEQQLGAFHYLVSANASGSVLSTTEESRLTAAQQSAIKDLKNQFPNGLPPTAPTESEESDVLIDAKSITGQTFLLGSGVAETEYAIDEDTSFNSYTGPFEVTGDGVHTVYYYSTDMAGNVELVQQLTVQIDTTAPTVTSVTGPPQPYSNLTSPTFTFSGVDPTVNGASSGIASFKYSTDDGMTWTTVTNEITYTTSTDPTTGQTTTTASSNVTLMGLSDGSQTFEVEAIDKAGNIGAATSYKWTVDTGAPTTSAKATGTLNSVTGWYTSDVAVTITPTDPPLDTLPPIPGSGVAETFYTIDGESYQTSSTSPITINLDDGTHTITYQSTDTAGNTQQQVTLPLQIDTTAPTVTVTSDVSNPSHSASATFNFSVSDATSGVNCSSVEYSLDGGTWTTATSPVTLADLSDGSHTFQLQASDNAGNISSSSYKWLIDTATLTGASSATATGGTSGQNPASLSARHLHRFQHGRGGHRLYRDSGELGQSERRRQHRHQRPDGLGKQRQLHGIWLTCLSRAWFVQFQHHRRR